MKKYFLVQKKKHALIHVFYFILFIFHKNIIVKQYCLK